jgi:shikimate dehydrogenase
MSPLIQNSAFRMSGLNFVYVASNVSEARFPAAVEGLRALGFAGANVTVPHKTAAVPLMDELTERASAVGAVNTIVVRTNGSRRVLVGDNTDVDGFCLPLEAFRGRIEGEVTIVLGAGGAARAVVYALLTRFRPAAVHVVNRTAARSSTLVQEMSRFANRATLLATDAESVRSNAGEATLVVNATSVGMYPNASETPWPHAEAFNSGMIVYDLVYNPIRTRLLSEAADRGATIIDGCEMLLGQAAAAFELWTGGRLPVNAVRPILRSHLEAAR